MLKKTSISVENTRKVAENAQASGSSATTKNPRRKETMSREKVKGDSKNGETSWTEEEYPQKKTSVEKPSQTKRIYT